MGTKENNTEQIWLGPRVVENPHFKNDVVQYLGEKIYNLWELCTDGDRKKRFEGIVELLDLYSHLHNLALFVKKNTTTKIEIRENGIKSTYYCIIDGVDYSAAHLDIESMSYYLLVSIINATQRRCEYEDPFDWIKKNKTNAVLDADASELPRLLAKCKEEYSECHGLTKNFIKAFQDKIKQETKQLICDSLIIVKVVDGVIEKSSQDQWSDLSESEKLKKIANLIYHFRSDYTHSGIRSFYPIVPIERSGISGKKVLLCKKGVSFPDILLKVIHDLCSDMLQSSDQ